ncbi:hypothetical protein NG701_07445 [Pseudarthrobacter sp. HLT3-5]|uniref:hypothetical protein n=1 Tax=Pseudarthrobacter cellobiosi TaxID=2953654 RepID=UPI00208FAB01|nr:hypothetical protein [Pseudarthrobacter sp. HLT3-5]MCO4274262.1 hypothetical protein [Pseudarthrobacter sp. HLT3-5]
MANSLFDKAREGFLSGQILWNSDNIKAVLVDTGLYTPSLSTNQYLSDIAAGARVATSTNLAGKTIANGVADAADVTFPAVTGASVEAIVLYKDTGTATTSRLICYIDSGVGGIPITPNGGDIATAWNASGIFKL